MGQIPAISRLWRLSPKFIIIGFMISRERVLRALDHCEPDRIPIDLSGHRFSGISAIAYAHLRNYLGLEKKPIRVYDTVQQLADVPPANIVAMFDAVMEA